METTPGPAEAGSRAGRSESHWLRADAAAGVTLAAYLLPAGLGDASLAGLPPQAGLYACLFSGLVFWLFCSSRHTAVSVTSAISLLLGTSLGGLAGGDSTRFAALAACTALLVGVIALIAWLIRAGVVVSFISETVLVGFKTGVALILASTQLPKLFGFPGGHGDFWQNMGHFFSHLDQTNTPALLIGMTALAALVTGKKWLKRIPVALLVIAVSVLVASLVDLRLRGVKLLGEVPQGLPPIGLPAVTWTDVNALLPLAMACFLLGAVETVAIGRMFALKHGYRIDPNREFLSLAAANLAAGLGQGFVVSGGMSQSLVNESGGARTPISGFVASLIILAVTVFFSGLLRNLPQPVLAAIVLMAVTGLFKLDAFKRLWRFSLGEFLIALVATLVVLGSGILNGVLIGAVLSIIMLLTRASRPHVAVLGRVRGTHLYGDVERNPENEQQPGLFVFRVDASLLYFNVEYIRQRFMDLLHAQTPAPYRVVWCLATTPQADLAGAELLAELRSELANRGIRLDLAEAHGPLRQTLRAAGLEAQFGPISENATIASVISETASAADDRVGGH